MKLEIFYAVVTAVFLASFVFEQRVRDKKVSYFVVLLVTDILLLVSDAFAHYFEGKENMGMVYLLFLFLSYVMSYALIVFYTYFVVSFIRQRAKLSIWFAHGAAFASLVAVVLWVIFMFNGMYYQIVGQRIVLGQWYQFSTVIGKLIVLMVVILVIVYQRKYSWSSMMILLSFEFVPVFFECLPLSDDQHVVLNLSMTISLYMIGLMTRIEWDKEFERQKTELVEGQVALMMSQIQPHFLYNSLNSIYYLCKQEPDVAQEAVSKFSLYLRENLDSVNKEKKIMFEREKQHIEKYVYLEQLRFQNELKVVYDIQVENFYVPPLSIQPLVANAVNHGLSKSPNGGTVWISTKENEQENLIVIKDDGIGFDKEKERVKMTGIDYIQMRLETLCDATLDIESSVGHGCICTVRIPKDNNEVSE